MSRGLIGLHQEVLEPSLAQGLAKAQARNLGPLGWQRRKATEGHELCAIAQRSPRVTLVGLDLRTELRARLRLDVPVLTRPDRAAEPKLERGADLALIYPAFALRTSLPGYAFVRVIGPRALWHPSAKAGEDQQLCLGVEIAAGTRVRELIVDSYRALAMQTLQVDERDRAGVMNIAAARWWQAHLDRAPLTTAGLFEEVCA